MSNTNIAEKISTNNISIDNHFNFISSFVNVIPQTVIKKSFYISDDETYLNVLNELSLISVNYKIVHITINKLKDLKYNEIDNKIVINSTYLLSNLYIIIENKSISYITFKYNEKSKL